MKRNKIGSLFLVSVLALAGIGISYAGFSAEITVFGTVETGTVNLELDGNYSGTWLFKIWDGELTGTTPNNWEIKPDDRVAIFRDIYTGNPDDFADALEVELGTVYTDGQIELVSYAYAKPGTDYDVDMTFWNIFPCTWYWADFIVHYTGSIPVHVTIENEDWPEDFANKDLWDFNYSALKGVLDDDEYDWEDDLEFPVQLHDCNKLWINVGIHMLQPDDVNAYQGQTYTFSFDIVATQWYDPCEDNDNGPN